MRTAEEQYQIQYKEIKQRWRKDRIRRALIMLTLGVVGIIVATVIYKFFISDNYTPWNFIIMLLGAGLAIVTPITILRIFTSPIRQENEEIKNLNNVYDEQRFISRK